MGVGCPAGAFIGTLAVSMAGKLYGLPKRPVNKLGSSYGWPGESPGIRDGVENVVAMRVILSTIASDGLGSTITLVKTICRTSLLQPHAIRSLDAANSIPRVFL